MHETLHTMHRDLKPQNILLIANNWSDIKLIDFGFSINFITNTNIINCCGSPKYMAPEIIKRKTNYNEKIDIWALGLITYELLTGGDFPFST